MSKANVISGNYLLNRSNGRVLPFTDELAKRGDMIPCTKADGSDAMLGLSGDEVDPEQAIPPFLKSISTGRILPYSQVLARSGGAVPHWPEPENENEADGEESTDGSESLSTGDDDEYWTEGDSPNPAETAQQDAESEDADPENEAGEEVQEIDLEAMDKKQIQAFLLKTYQYKMSLNKVRTDEKARAVATHVIENNEPV